MWTNSESDPIGYRCETYECHVGFGEPIVAYVDSVVAFDPSEEVLNHTALPADLRQTNRSLLRDLARDDREPATGLNVFLSSSILNNAFSTPSLKVRARCGSTARRDLCGGLGATRVPTATAAELPRHLSPPQPY